MIMGSEEATGQSRTARRGLQATSDPALPRIGRPRGGGQALDYARALQPLGAPAVGRPRTSISASDKIDWNERFDEEERFQRMYGLGAFFIGEQKVADELGPIMRACPDRGRSGSSSAPRSPTRPATCASSSASTARSASSTPRTSADMLARPESPPQRGLRRASSRRCSGSRVNRLARRSDRQGGPGRGDHDLPHDHRGNAGAHRPALHHRLQRAKGTLPGFVEGFNNVARDEHRHVAFGAALPARPAEEDDKYTRGDRAHDAGGAAGRRPGPGPAVGGRRCPTTSSSSAYSLDGHTRVRREKALIAAPEGDRARLGGARRARRLELAARGEGRGGVGAGVARPGVGGSVGGGLVAGAVLESVVICWCRCWCSSSADWRRRLRACACACACRGEGSGDDRRRW